MAPFGTLWHQMAPYDTPWHPLAPLFKSQDPISSNDIKMYPIITNPMNLLETGDKWSAIALSGKGTYPQVQS